jgi:excisionase family DNA binding protein
MENVVFTQLSIPEFRRLIQEELEQYNSKSMAKNHTSAPPADSPFITKKEAAKLISVSPSTIDNAARAGRIKRHYIGSAVRFDRTQVLSLAKKV